MFEIIIVLVGLICFEVISSVDNAIVNAHVLKGLPEKFRRFFLIWGLLIAVFLMRGILPFVLIWIANPAFNLVEVFTVAFSSSDVVEASLNESKPLLLLSGGIYLFMVFLSWLFLEEKKYAFFVENFMHKQGMWFYFFSSLLFTVILYFALQVSPALGLAAAIGSTAFFLTDGFKKNAEEQEKRLMTDSTISAWSKILYLEVLDASFSIDGVIGAFAFTMSVPLILLGNGVGAFIVREVTIKGIDTIGRFAYLKNGAMYSIGMLGGIMILDAFNVHFEFWIAPIATLLLITVFGYMSVKEICLAEQTTFKQFFKETFAKKQK